LTIGILLGVFVVWVRPSVMAWSILLAMISYAPARVWVTYLLAFDTDPEHSFVRLPVALFAGGQAALVEFALYFPRNTLAGWSWWKRALGLMVVPMWLFWLFAFWLRPALIVPFESDYLNGAFVLWVTVTVLSCLVAIAILWHTYRRSDGGDGARLRWAILGMSASLAATSVLLDALTYLLSSLVAGSAITPAHWAFALCSGVFWPLALGNAILRQRLVDVQFAVSRTLVFGAVSTLALVFVAAVHWLLGRMIEQSHLAIGLEGLAAIGIGLVLHRFTHGINLLFDRVLFRKHHQAEQRLRRVTAALPYAADERSIAEVMALEPVRNLDLASAALFYRDSPEGPLRRVLAHGWSGGLPAAPRSDPPGPTARDGALSPGGPQARGQSRSVRRACRRARSR